MAVTPKIRQVQLVGRARPTEAREDQPVVELDRHLLAHGRQHAQQVGCREQERHRIGGLHRIGDEHLDVDAHLLPQALALPDAADSHAVARRLLESPFTSGQLGAVVGGGK